MNMAEANLKLVLEVLALIRQWLEQPMGVQMTKQQIVAGIDKVSAAVEVALADTQYWGEKHRLLIQKELAAAPPQRKPLTYCQECMRPNPIDGTDCAHGIKEST